VWADNYSHLHCDLRNQVIRCRGAAYWVLRVSANLNAVYYKLVEPVLTQHVVVIQGRCNLDKPCRAC